MVSHTGLLSNQGAKSINCYFIMDPFFKKKVLKYGTPKPSIGERMGGRERERGCEQNGNRHDRRHWP